MKEVNKLLVENLARMEKTGKLFVSAVSNLPELYLGNTRKDLIFKVGSIFNCNNCLNFIRRYGNIVAIDENLNILTLWDGVPEEEDYKEAFSVMSTALKAAPIVEVFFESYDSLNSLPYERVLTNQASYQLGIPQNTRTYTAEELKNYTCSLVPGKVYSFNHANVKISKAFVLSKGKSIATAQSEYRSSMEVFERAMEEIPTETFKLVRDLINQNSLLRATSYLDKLVAFIRFSEAYSKLDGSLKKNLYCWKVSYNLPFAKFKNELMGTLCTEIASGKDLNEACVAYNKFADPANYMKAAPPRTQKQINEAKKFIAENGYEESFNRRIAVIGDIKVDLIKHINETANVAPITVLDSIKPSGIGRHKSSEFDGIETVSIENFLKNILPGCTSVEAFVSNKLVGNFVTMHTSINPNSKPIFKWPNNFGWTYRGNLTGVSQIKQAVKSRGGKFGQVNIRLHFPNTVSDYDLHVSEPNKYEVYFSNVRKVSPNGGMLDLDAQGVDGHQGPELRVENITYSDLSKMTPGVYSIFVRNYTTNDRNFGFNVEVDILGKTYELTYDKYIVGGRTVQIGKLIIEKNDCTFEKSEEMLLLKESSSTVYGIETEQFHEVSLVCMSPNYWETKIGNPHYFFMLKNCHVDNEISSFHNEFMIPEFKNHRNVIEVYSDLAKVSNGGKNELSGLGFDATLTNELVLRLKGSFKRVIKVTF